MNLEERKEFDRLKEKALWFGKAFLASKGGTVWEGVVDHKHFYQYTWFDFYFGLLKHHLEDCGDELLLCPLKTYDRKALSEEVSGMIREITALEIPSPPPGTPAHEMKWERISTDINFVELRYSDLNFLYEKDIIYNAPWNEPSAYTFFLIISADNRFFKNHLLAIYTGLTEQLNAAPAEQLAPAVEPISTARQTGSGLKHEPGLMEKEIERLKNEIKALKSSGRAEPTTNKWKKISRVKT